LRVRFAFLCDSVEQSLGGKISALGIGFKNFTITNLQMPLMPFCLVVNLEINRSEIGQKYIEVYLMDADGISIIPPLKREIEMQVPPNSGGRVFDHNFIFNFAGLKFPKYADYSFSVTLNGTEICNLPICIVKPPNNGY